MKVISILIPTYNEEDNIIPLYESIVLKFKTDIQNYNYEIVIIDNYSTDSTRAKIESICARDKSVKAIFNARNFGPHNSHFYGILQTTGDCVISLCADFQDPISMIPQFIYEWEHGYRIVIGVKSSSRENLLMYFIRTFYYKLIKKIAEIEHVEHFTGFGLYDKSFIEILRNLNDPLPYFRGIVSELGYHRKKIQYDQSSRRSGKTKHNWYTLYDAAMLGITSYSKIGLRLATLLGMMTSFVSFIIGVIYLILKLLYWDEFPIGIAPLLVSIFFLGSIQLFFVGFLGEYILNINARVMKRPLVTEERRINF